MTGSSLSRPCHLTILPNGLFQYIHDLFLKDTEYLSHLQDSQQAIYFNIPEKTQVCFAKGLVVKTIVFFLIRHFVLLHFINKPLEEKFSIHRTT